LPEAWNMARPRVTTAENHIAARADQTIRLTILSCASRATRLSASGADFFDTRSPQMDALLAATNRSRSRILRSDFRRRPSETRTVRAASSNSALIKAAIAVAPKGIEWDVYEQLGDLPHFSPDLDVDPPPAPVARLRALVASAQAVLICTPEYAHGVPGSLKNALDWLLSSGEFSGKPVALFVASVGGEWARASLTQTLEVIEARVIAEAGLSIPNARKRLDPQGNLSDPSLGDALKAKLGGLISSVRADP